MKLQEFKKIKEGDLLTIRNQKGEVCDIFHYSRIFELRHHNYNNEVYYYLSMRLQPKLEQINKTTKKDIEDYYNHKKESFKKQLENILELKKEIK